jgi:hypothetical protein
VLYTPLASTDWSAFAVSAGLVIATIGLVYFTRGLVSEARATRSEAIRTREEMRESRLLSVRPHLALDLDLVGPRYAVVVIKNLGPGSALDVALTLSFDPSGDTRAWEKRVFTPHESHQFLLPQRIGDIGVASDEGMVIRARGRYTDVHDNEFELNHSFDVRAWWEAEGEAFHRFDEGDMTKIRRTLDKIKESVEEISKAARS